MNREIKFRIWNNRTTQWIHEPGNEINLFGERILLGAFMDDVSIEELNDCVALQYTGINDRDGKEIYEGDIITVNEYLNGKIWEGHIHNAEVIFYGGKFTFSPIWHHQSFNRNELIVIGNIFENPELLDIK